MLQSELHGEQQPEETERVPDNYPYRLPPLSGRKEHTESIVGNQKGCGYDRTLLIQPFNSSLIANVETVEKVYETFTSFLHLGTSLQVKASPPYDFIINCNFNK